MKRGTFAASGSLTALAAAILPQSEPILSLAEVALQCFQNDEDKGLVIIDFGRRKVGYKKSVSGDFAALDAAITSGSLTGFTDAKTLTIADPTKTSGVWGIESDAIVDILTPLGSPAMGTDLDAELNVQFGFAQPSKSFSGMIASVEDAFLALAARTVPVDCSGVLLYDQLTGGCRLLELAAADTSAIADFTAGITSHVTQEVFTQTVTAAGGTGGINNI